MTEANSTRDEGRGADPGADRDRTDGGGQSAPDGPAAAVDALIRASRLLEKTSTELSLADFRVLSAIEAGEERASRVAARLSIGRPSISATVDSLARRGYLERGQVHHDQRAESLSLTTEGRAVRARAEAALIRTLDGLIARSERPERIVPALADLGSAIEAEIRERAAGLPAEAAAAQAEASRG